MMTVKHEPVYRFGKFEQPVTVITDDGEEINDVLFFSDAKGAESNFDTALMAMLDRRTLKPEGPQEPEIISVAEVEAILREKKVLSESETWSDLKARQVDVVKEVR